MSTICLPWITFIPCRGITFRRSIKLTVLKKSYTDQDALKGQRGPMGFGGMLRGKFSAPVSDSVL